MPPKPWDDPQLPGTSASRQQQQQRTTFSGHRDDYHANAASSSSSRANGKVRVSRWSYSLQDIPDKVMAALHDVNKGYVARLAGVVGLAGGLSYLFYTRVVVPSQERRPLAQRSSWLSPPVPITLVEKRREEGSNIYVYRFALPNSYDYAGYEPVSSVRIMSGRVRELSSLSRWYTPISHPDERGFIEFAIKDCDPGRMSGRLRYLERGDVVYLGQWMREFRYDPARVEAHRELGLICSTSGASVALQLMKVMDLNKALPARLHLLYCHPTAQSIPFKETAFADYKTRNKDRIFISYDVLSGGRRKGDAKPREENMFVGNIDPEMIAATMPPPVRLVSSPSSSTSPEEGAATPPQAVRTPLLVCGPQSMMMFLCGRVSTFGNHYYWQGPPYRFGGFLKDMGYTRDQVYKFGVSTHFLADH